MKFNEVNEMSNEEHLIENAVFCIERGGKYEDFAGAKINIEMAKYSKIDLKQVWRMAIHVVCTLKESWVSDVVGYFQGQKLFHPDMEEYIERFL